MFDPIDFDPALAVVWPPGQARPAPYGTGVGDDLDAAVKTVWLETKAAAEPSPAEETQRLLSEMHTELKAQFEVFRKIRADADARLDGGDDNEQKLAKADLKAAIDALSLITRTIEKIDGLQRSLARDIETAAEQDVSDAEYDEMVAGIERKIDERAAERMRAWLAECEAGGGSATGPPVDAG
jgi:hypothetical protein